MVIGSWSWAQEPVPQWGLYGIVVNDTPGNTLQQNPRVVQVGQEYVVVFEDYRSGQADLYLQKLDARGNLLWDQDGVPVCRAAGDQTYPRIVASGSDGVIVVWQDYRQDNFDIYAQKIDLTGKVLWKEDGIPVCAAAHGQVFPQVAEDGLGGVIVTWHDYRSGTEDIYAQWVGVDGNLFWQEGGVAVCQEPGTQWYPRIINDRAFGTIICWVDRRRGNQDIYAQKLDNYGKPVWPAGGVEVCAAEGNQDNPVLVFDRQGGAIIAWQDLRMEAPGIYYQMISADGKPTLKTNGALLATESINPGSPVIAGDGAGGAVVVFSDPHAGDPDLYVQRLNMAGQPILGEAGMPLVRLRGVQENPKIIGSGPWIICWEDARSFRKQIYIQKMDLNNYLSYGGGGVLVSDKGIDPQSASLTWDGEVMLACFQDKRKGNFDIYAQRVGKKGELLLGATGVLVNSTPGSVVQQNAKMIRAKDGNFIFAFEDFRSGFSNIYLQKVTPAGKLLWNEAALPAAEGNFNQKNPDLISDGTGGVILAWEDYRNASGPLIYAQRVGFTGQLIFGVEGKPLTPKITSNQQTKPKLAEDGAGGAIIIFCDYRGTLNYQDIFAQRIDKEGDLKWGQAGLCVSAGNGNQDDPQIAPKSLVVTWTDYRMGDRNSDIYAQKISLSGKVLWQEDGLPVCEAPDSQLNTQILDNGGEGVIIVWTDRGGGSYDIYAQRLDAVGRPLWIKDGIPVCQVARTQQNPKICLVGPAQILIVWEDFRFGNWDIFAQRLSDSGRLKFAEEGIPICQYLGTQYAPFAISASDQSILTWEDYRSTENYHIYLQSLDETGQKLWGEEGFLVKGSQSGGRTPFLLNDQKDSFVLSWEDYRQGGRAIYAQRFTF